MTNEHVMWDRIPDQFGKQGKSNKIRVDHYLRGPKSETRYSLGSKSVEWANLVEEYDGIYVAWTPPQNVKENDLFGVSVSAMYTVSGSPNGGGLVSNRFIIEIVDDLRFFFPTEEPNRFPT